MKEEEDQKQKEEEDWKKEVAEKEGQDKATADYWRRQVKVSPHLFHNFHKLTLIPDVKEREGGVQGLVGGSWGGEYQDLSSRVQN